MSVQYHPEYLKAIEPMLPVLATMQPPAVHDVKTRRANFDAVFRPLMDATPPPPNVDVKIHHAQAKDGHSIPIYHYTKQDSTTSGSLPALFYTHGGGYVALDVAIYNNVIASTCAATGVQIFAVDYRLAPEHPFPTPIEDCYTGLQWLYDHVSTFNVDPARVAVYGDSAGGGLAASLAIMARDRKLSPPLAKQILIYPMIDDRNLKPALHEELMFWKLDDNLTGWTAYVGEDKVGKDGVSPYAAAARVESVEGLPPTYIDVGTLDFFRDEDLHYASRIAAAGIETEFHLYPGLPHAFEVLAAGTDVVNRVLANRVKAFTSF